MLTDKARLLIKSKLKSKELAKHLGISESMFSACLNSMPRKHGNPRRFSPEQIEKIKEYIQKHIKDCETILKELE